MRTRLVIAFSVCAMSVSLGFGDNLSVSTTSGSVAVGARIEELRKFVDELTAAGDISYKNNVKLRSKIDALVRDKVMGLPVAAQREAVRAVVGDDRYIKLEKIFTQQLASSDGAYQRSALRTLGYPLFALSARDALKAFVFHEDRNTQLLAVEALVYLDVPGANHLLKNVIFCGVLDDKRTADALEALHVSGDSDLNRMALELIKSNPGPLTVRILLPILKGSPNYRDIVASLFVNDRYQAPEVAKLTLTQHANVNVEYSLLKEIYGDTAFFLGDKAIKKKVMMYADSTVHQQLYIMALLVLEKSGQDIEYFVAMSGQDQLPETKKKVLDLIVGRIREGKRIE